MKLLKSGGTAPRHFIDKYMTLTGGLGLNGDPTRSHYSNVSQQAYRNTKATKEDFKLATWMLCGGLENIYSPEASRDKGDPVATAEHLYYLSDDRIAELITMFDITQTDCLQKPALRKFLSDKMLDHLPAGAKQEPKKNRNNLKKGSQKKRAMAA